MPHPYIYMKLKIKKKFIHFKYILSKVYDYLYCLVNEKPKKSLILQNRVGHTTSFNERKQLPMKKEKEKKIV